jgi:DNA-binding CsgD family transcriptional regulator
MRIVSFSWRRSGVRVRTASEEVLAGLLVVGFALALLIAIDAGAQEALSHGGHRLGRVIGAALVIAVPALAIARRRDAVVLLEDHANLLITWALITVLAFLIDGPGDQLLLPAALGPVGLAGLLGEPRRAFLCAAVVDAGYLGVLGLHGHSSWRHDGVHLALEDAAFVLLTAFVIVFPVRMARQRTRAALASARELSLRADACSGLLSQGRVRVALPSGAPSGESARAGETARPRGGVRDCGEDLTEQELRVLKRVCAGEMYAAISLEESEILGRPCSEHRVYRIVARIKGKLGVETRGQLEALDLSQFGI